MLNGVDKLSKEGLELLNLLHATHIKRHSLMNLGTTSKTPKYQARSIEFEQKPTRRLKTTSHRCFFEIVSRGVH